MMVPRYSSGTVTSTAIRGSSRTDKRIRLKGRMPEYLSKIKHAESETYSSFLV
jgi:hypothetical protein